MSCFIVVKTYGELVNFFNTMLKSLEYSPAGTLRETFEHKKCY